MSKAHYSHWYRQPDQHLALPLQSTFALRVFLCFAFAYFMSYAFRTINVVIAPDLVKDLGLNNADLGLLSSAYFIGFGATQIPLGLALDRFGPRITEAWVMILAVIGALIFAIAEDFTTLVMARVLIGMGVSACLMAAFSGFRAWYAPSQQGQLASAMLVCGTSGALASTWPVHLVTPYIGWRGVFLVMAALSFLAILILYFGLPVKKSAPTDKPIQSTSATLSWQSYRPILTNSFFWRILPLGTFCYGGFIAVQTLWFGPWLIEVMDYPATTAAQIVFGFNVVLLLAYLFNTWVLPKLARRGIDTMRYMTWMVGMSMIMQAGAYFWQTSLVWVWWYLFAITCASFVLAQSIIVLYFPKNYSGRVSTTYNLTLFIGAFIVQWGIGHMLDLGIALGWNKTSAYDLALAVFLAIQILGFIWFLIAPHYFPMAVFHDDENHDEISIKPTN
jgi:predicted MFS family arabinose efflux permease